ncbi:2-hydroxyacid dehydrogenase [Vibrio gazogenes]|uniref:D-3-phosphoglycerate dehydrogenase n=1 Tax=Vibrio gazogenes DSM 21264 = NBRC 103151 TaxID=1123492 RepID=A0A1M5BPD7_VIBGA|nr:2-hydroxyacid dehydrogenase [Vibrio gazogenes]USP13717.1 2-hydroxyacid dehydrogenase [Vibrio gazogenes]SHF44255.1 D-3-phosphoglycerate dehydrogenase [Vibrio gazogenes DSM 21264] [Vibrio gazogenes DSM 21264 = NBRC 103151]SJN55449.1 Putative 2-hydroxyacid dehydrogenase YoaD [Vibrio gazogenes]
MKILFTAEHDNNLEKLKELGDVIISGWALGNPKLTEDELIELAKDCDIIITSYDDITEKVIIACDQLKLIACTRATPVNVDCKAASKRNIPVIYTPGRNSDATAELTIAHMLCVARNIPQAHMALKNGEYTDANRAGVSADGVQKDAIWDVTSDSPYEVFKGFELHGKTLGIIGYGSIGRRVGRIARGFGMALAIYDPFLSAVDVNEPGVKIVSLDELLCHSDFVTLHLKVSESTIGFLNKERIGMMKQSAFLINTSRAAVLDEDAVIEALRENKIRGAGFDVYAHEPICADHPYINELNNVTITPHIAGATAEVLTNHTNMIIDDINRFLKNEPLLHQYN